MTSQLTAPIQPHRGTILVDGVTRCLQGNILPDRRSYKIPAPENLLHILPFFARNGYEVVVPEIVTYVVADTLAKGSLYSAFAHKADRPDHPDAMARTFFRQFVENSKNYPGMRIASPADSASERVLLDRLGNTLTSSMEESDKRMTISQFQKEYPVDSKAVSEALLSIMAQQPQGPIFLLSDHLESSGVYSRRHPEHNIVNPAGLLKAMRDSGIHTELGMRPETRWETLANDLRKQNDYFPDADRPPVDCTGNEYIRYAPQSGRFTASLRQLAADLAEARNTAPAPQQTAVPHTPPPAASQPQPATGQTRLSRVEQYRLKAAQARRPHTDSGVQK